MLHNYFNKKLCNVRVLDRRGNFIVGTIENREGKIFFNNLEDKENIVEFSIGNRKE